MHIKLRHLEVVNALFEAGSVARAAERLNLSQPAVSIALCNLEDQTGFRLFHRDRGFFAPTNEALLLRDEVQQGMDVGVSGDLLAIDIRTVLHHIGEITGEISTDEVLGNIFSKFCIGK